MKIGQLVAKLLLETSYDYQQIVDEVKKLHPTAGTTPKSIATIASNMRKFGGAAVAKRTGTGRGVIRGVTAGLDYASF